MLPSMISPVKRVLLLGTALAGSLAVSTVVRADQATGCTPPGQFSSGTITCTPAGNTYTTGILYTPNPVADIALTIDPGVVITGTAVNGNAGILVGTNANRLDANVTISNAGSVTLPGSATVVTNGTPNTVSTLALGASVEGSHTVSIDNTGNLTAGSGIGTTISGTEETGPVSTSTTNSGAIGAVQDGIYAQTLPESLPPNPTDPLAISSATVTITNSGAIAGMGPGQAAQTGIFASGATGNTSAAVGTSTVQVINSGSILATGTGIEGDASAAVSGSVSITNSANITGVPTATTVNPTVGISSTVTTGATGTATVSVQNSATINATQSGITVSATAQTATISVSNSGVIVIGPNAGADTYNSSPGAIAVGVASVGGSIFVDNTGTITATGLGDGSTSGIAASANFGTVTDPDTNTTTESTTTASVTVNNSGSVTVNGNNGGTSNGSIGVVLSSAAVSTLTNSGTIVVTDADAAVEFTALAVQQAEPLVIAPADATAVVIPPGAAVLNNLAGGVIENTNGTAILSGDQPTTITNSGRIASDLAGGNAILMGAGANTLIVTPGSSITGFVINGSTQTAANGGDGGQGNLIQPQVVAVPAGTVFTVNAANKLALAGTGQDTFDVGQIADTPAQLGYTPTPDGTQYQTDAYVTDAVHQYQGFSRFEKTGDSTWILNGTTTNDGPWTVNGGTLVVNGSIANAAFTVGNNLIDPVIGGTGTIGSLTATAGGVVAPGVLTPYSTLTVVNNVTFAQGSIFRVAVNASGQTDLLLAGGTANLSGGAVAVLANGTFTANRRYTILTAAGGLGGTTFTGVTVNSLFLLPTLSYDADDVFLNIQAQFRAFGNTPNERATAGALETLPLDAPLIQALLPLGAGQITGALNGLSGEVHASAVTAGIEDTRFPRESIFDRLDDAATGGPTGALGAVGPFGGLAPALPAGAQGYAPVHKGYDMPVLAAAAPPPPPYTAWGTGFGDFGRNGGNGNAASLDRSLGGFVLGVDARIDGAYFNNWRIGVAGGYTNDDLRVSGRGSSGSFETYFGGLYAGAQYGAVDIKLGVLGGGTSTETRRTIAFPGFLDTARSNYDGTVVQGFGEVGYKVGLAHGFFEPLVQGAVIHLDQDGFHERGGAAALSGASRGYDVETVTAGLRAEAALPYGGLPLIARAFLGYRHAFGDVDPKALLAFEAGGSAFTIAGAPIDQDAVVAEAGLDYRASANLTLGVNYSGQAGDRAYDNAVKGRMEYRF